jgi:hypothetical protein
MTLDLIDHLLIDYHLFFFASLGRSILQSKFGEAIERVEADSPQRHRWIAGGDIDCDESVVETDIRLAILTLLRF